MADLHPLVQATVAAYLAEVDAAAPGLVEGLYLTGSVALGDFRPRTSDVDFVAVTAERPGATGAKALARVHARLKRRWPRPHFDGLYVTWAELASDPAARRGPSSHEGRFRAEWGPGDPVTWYTVARYGVASRGPAPASVAVWNDETALTAWTLDNLDRYWGRLLDRAGRPWDRWGLAALGPYGAAWIVLGVSRLHYTLATGDIASKEAAGRYALRTFAEERWQPVVSESLRLRCADVAEPGIAGAIRTAGEYMPSIGRRPATGSSVYRTPFARRRDVLAFAHMAVADAKRRFR